MRTVGPFRSGNAAEAQSPSPPRGTNVAPPSSQATSMAAYPADLQYKTFRRKHRCWREPCRFLFPGVLGEQLTKASLHFYQLALLARRLNRTIVLPNVADSRIESCLLYPFTTYFDIGDLGDMVEWIEVTEFVEILRDRFRNRPYGPGDLRKRPNLRRRGLVDSAIPSRALPGPKDIATTDDPTMLKYNLQQSLTNPPWITAQYLVFSVRSLSPEVDRHHPRGLRELLKCYREKMINPTGAPANPLPFTRPMLNFVPPENRVAGETDDTWRFAIRPRRHADEAEVWDAYARSVFATLESLADVDVLGVHYTWRKPYLFPSVALTPLNYNPALWARARRVVTTYMARPFVAVHWRMETVDPRGMPACADTLAQHLRKVKKDLLEARRSAPSANSPGLSPEDISVFLANDLPPNEGELLRHRATTFVNASRMYYAARQRLLDVEPAVTTWRGLSAEDRRRAAEEGRVVPDEPTGEARGDTGILGIIDKLVCSLADHFVSGPPGCSKGSSFTEQIVALRSGRSRWLPPSFQGAGGLDGKDEEEANGGAARVVDTKRRGAQLEGPLSNQDGEMPTLRFPANVSDIWPGPSVWYVRQVAAEYGVSVGDDAADLGDSSEWLGR
ncbi:MAG: hypothetical protein BJ554DRAFT_1055 [Olpidium bornovanus]|uniref:GDP-fucose protein O-fucosyltransferase 2 n=1 Tax=Olpidium bornovanus TaxID=278681 RepID=A0A8H8DI37_9FUNG|nr:MAG: hypothetical protein BJ554DRAFT_1055 [Olpidium bornovanus]